MAVKSNPLQEKNPPPPTYVTPVETDLPMPSRFLVMFCMQPFSPSAIRGGEFPHNVYSIKAYI